MESSDGIVVRRHRPDVQIALYMGLLMLFGLIMMYAIGPQRAHVLNESIGTNYSDMHFFVKQLISVGLALFAFIVLAIIPYKWILKHSQLWLYIGIGLCLLLAVASFTGMSLAEETYGATRWFDLGPLGSLQPAELLKFAIVIYLASFLAKRIKDKEVNSWQESLIPVAIIVALASFFIVVLQKDLGTGSSLFAIVLVMLLVARVSLRNLAIIVGAVMVAGVLLIVTAPHRMERIATFMQGDTYSSQTADNYHIEHAKIAIGAGGLTGVGVGNSVQATGYLPEAINDSVFAIMGETFGFVGLTAIIILFVALFMRLVGVIDHIVDERLKLLVSGVFGWLVAHFTLNIGAMIGVLPLTGITLPLLSFGGSSMVIIAAALGLVFQISGFTQHGRKLKEASHEGIGSRRRVGRTRHTSRRRVA